MLLFRRLSFSLLIIFGLSFSQTEAVAMWADASGTDVLPSTPPEVTTNVHLNMPNTYVVPQREADPLPNNLSNRPSEDSPSYIPSPSANNPAQPPTTRSRATRSKTKSNTDPVESGTFGQAGSNGGFQDEPASKQKQPDKPQQQPAAATPATPSPLVAQAQDQLNECRKQAAIARKCCTNPVACLTGSSDAQGAYQMLNQLAATGSTVMLGASGGDPAQLQQICNVMQDISYGSSAANAGFAGVCYTEKSSCQDKCELSQYKSQMDGLTPDEKAKLTTSMSDASTQASSCQQLNEQVAQMSKQAVQGAVGGSLSSLCANISKASTGYSNLDKQAVFNVDCTAAINQANPACLNCGQAQNANNPICKNQTASTGQSLGDGSLSSLSSKANFGAGLGAANVNANAGLDGNGTAKNIAGGAATPTSNPGVAANAGQFLGGASAGSNFGLPDRGGSGRGQGYNTDVLNGTSGGGGYTVSSVPTTSSPGGGTFMSTDKDGKPVDLRDYLPGHRLDPKRAVASVPARDPMLNNKFANIFELQHVVYARLWNEGRFIMVDEKPGDEPSAELVIASMERPLMPIEIKTGQLFKGPLPPEYANYAKNHGMIIGPSRLHATTPLPNPPSAQNLPSLTPQIAQALPIAQQVRQPAQAQTNVLQLNRPVASAPKK